MEPGRENARGETETSDHTESATHVGGYTRAKRQTRELFAPATDGSLSQWVDVTIAGLIVLNVVGIALGTVDWIHARYADLLWGLEIVSVAVFTVEYVARLWSCTAEEAYSHPVFGRLRFARKPFLVVDLLAILPFYAGALVFDLRFLRALRLLRLFRIVKLARYSESMRQLAAVAREKREDLVITFAATGVLLVVAASLMYFIEHEAQPETFSSIPAAMWWGVVTLTTVGYGDVYPVTPLGRAVSAVIAVLGIGLFALPASILASGFVEEAAADAAEEAAEEAADETAHAAGDSDSHAASTPAAQAGELDPSAFAYCPHCGGELDRRD